MDVKSHDVILVLDVGTTNVKAAIISTEGEILRLESTRLKTTSPERGWCEISPDVLWADILNLIRSVSAPFRHRILTLGVTTQRGTFTTLNTETGRYLHNFITWTDDRAAELCRYFNTSYSMKMGRWFLWMFAVVTKNDFLKCCSGFQVTCNSVLARSKWVVDEVPGVRELHRRNVLQLVTLDAWLIHKLTGGYQVSTDYTSAGATGYFDLWQLKFCPIQTYTFSVPYDTLPEVRVSDAFYGRVASSLNLGFSSPITGLIADQQASLLGNQLFSTTDMKLTLGTVFSAQIVTGTYTHPTAGAIFPQIGYKLYSKDFSYVAEASSMVGGGHVDWLVKIGLMDAPSHLDAICASVSDTGGVIFTGKEMDKVTRVVDLIENGNVSREEHITRCFVGVTSNSTVAHLVRAVAEYLAFECRELVLTLSKAYQRPKVLAVDGGVSRSKFILQTLADLTSVTVKQLNSGEGSLMGAFFVAGIGMEVWRNLEHVKEAVSVDYTFYKPRKPSAELLDNMNTWKQNRCLF